MTEINTGHIRMNMLYTPVSATYQDGENTVVIMPTDGLAKVSAACAYDGHVSCHDIAESNNEGSAANLIVLFRAGANLQGADGERPVTQMRDGCRDVMVEWIAEAIRRHTEMVAKGATE